MDWHQSTHTQAGVDCSDCHQIHTAKEGRACDPAGCKSCHADVLASFRLPSHHPILEGKMKCSACHQVHGQFGESLRTSERPNDLCLECHAAKQGPFVFEHEPVVEDCMTCHRPHGAVANSLLKQNEPFLCLTCHSFHFHAGLESWEDTAVNVAGTDYPNPNGTAGYKVAFTTKCTQCHAQIHGSDLPSQGVTGRGRGLTR
jgi:DmsE family decaheme c-type cytochrome